MSFVLSIETLRQVGTIYNVSKLIFATKSVIEEIGSNEFNAAIHSLDDMPRSNCPERELNMAISHLRSALEHFASKSDGFFWSITAMQQRFETALLISLCYKILSEHTLCCQYGDYSIEYFSEWLEAYSHCPSGKLHWKELFYDRVKDEVNRIGLSWTYSYPEGGFFDFLSNNHHRKFDAELYRHKELIKEQYKHIVRKIVDTH